MPRARLKYVNAFRSKGKVYHYFRHGDVSERLRGEPGSAQYMARYADLLGQVEKPSVGTPHPHGSVDWLLTDYRASPKFTRLAATTQDSYSRMIEKFRPIGPALVGKVARKHIQVLGKPLLDRPRTADEFAKVASILFAHAVDLGLISINPAAGIAKVNKTIPYRPWTDQEIETFEKSCPPGPLLTAFMLGIYTGQRREDILLMGWAAYDNGRIAVLQGKTGVALRIPAHSKLHQHLETLRRETLMVPSRTGKAWDNSAFSKAFRKALNAAGLPKDAYFHGLRKTAAKYLAEAGCSEAEIMSITGHRTSAMVQHYIREVNKDKMAISAMDKLEASEKNSNKQ